MTTIELTWLREWEQPKRPPEVLFWLKGVREPKIYQLCLN